MPQWLKDLWAALFPPPPPLFASGHHEFNSRQLSSYQEAHALVDAINGHPLLLNGQLRVMGGGVLPGDDSLDKHEDGSENRFVGIYIPAWLVGPAGFRQGQAVDSKTGVKYYSLHLRFRNGKQGMNVGLILDKFARYPNSQDYVLRQIAAEAENL